MMPLQAYKAPESHLRRSLSRVSVGNRPNNHVTSQSLDSETARKHALLAANIAMERSRGSASDSVSRQDSKRSTISPAVGEVSDFHDIISSVQRQEPSISSIPPPQNRDTANSKLAHIPPTYEAMIMAKEFGAMNETYGAQPSSYRRLRKAKSLVDPGTFAGRTQRTTNATKTSSHVSALQKVSSSMSLRAPSLKLRFRHSLHMLRSPRHRSGQTIPFQPELGYRPESIALARSEFLKLSGTPQSPGESPRTLKSAIEPSPISFRTSLRSDKTRLSARLPEDTEPSKSSSPPFTKRSFSASVRNRIKRAFGRSIHGATPIPAQQLEASRHHFTEALDNAEADKALDSYCDEDPDLSRRASFYFPSEASHDVYHSEIDLSPGIGKAKDKSSLGSTSRSRMTSWTNSSLSSLSRGNNHEPKRLSIIKEDSGPHQPSSSVGRHLGGISVFQQPLNLDKGIQIDSQRVYSALLKRIDREQAEMEQAKVTLEEIHESQEEGMPSICAESTVRRVQSETSMAAVSICDEEVHSVQEDDFDSESHNSEPWARRQESGFHQRRKRLQERQSTFFGSSSGTEPQKPSPFRKLLRERQSNIQEPSSTCAASGALLNRATDRHKLVDSSESIYSRSTNGGRNLDYPGPIGSTDTILHLESGCNSSSMATIFHSENAIPKPERNQSTDETRMVSMTASEKGRWKGWVENQMAYLTRGGSQGRRHLREHAQVDPYDVEIGSLPQTAVARLSARRRHPVRTPHVSIKSIKQPVDSGGSSRLQSPSALRDTVTPNQSSITRPLHENDSAYDQMGIHNPEPQQRITDNNQQAKTKLLSGSKTQLLRFKSQPLLRPQNGVGKENRPHLGSHNNSTKLQAHQSFELQTPSAERGLRETSANLICPDRSEKDTLSVKSLATDERTPQKDSKTMFASRLSRPFDMDVPEYNRPFDSMYLGKSDYSGSEISKIARLSVAANTRSLRNSKSYGGLGLPCRVANASDARANIDSDTTALPQLPEEDGQARVSSFNNFANNGKRMVSNFLRSRRKKSGLIEASPELGLDRNTAFI